MEDCLRSENDRNGGKDKQKIKILNFRKFEKVEMSRF